MRTGESRHLAPTPPPETALHSPQLCSSAPSEHSWTPLQWAVAGRQVWLEHRKPLHCGPSETPEPSSAASCTASSTAACRLTTVSGVFVRAVLAVVVAIAHPALRDAVTRVALEAVGLAGMVAHWGQTERNGHHTEDRRRPPPPPPRPHPCSWPRPTNPCSRCRRRSATPRGCKRLGRR